MLRNLQNVKQLTQRKPTERETTLVSGPTPKN